MRNFSKKLAFVLAAAMVFTAFAPAAKADAADKEMTMNRASQTLYVNEDGVNQKGAETLPEGLYGNVQTYDFYVKNKPANYAKELNFVWKSSDPKVAEVNEKNGDTKAVAVGTATITCTITDKATGDPVTEVSAKVTVKANAASVVITNAEDYDTLPVPEDGVVDLNRAMYDEDGNKTSKRGTFVTDYTRWIAEDADGKAVAATVVAIDQATGKFTFAADAPAGDYTLYCQTYQSEKYDQATATSEKITVTVVETKAEVEDVDQASLTKFTVNFTAPVDSLKKEDVTVKKVLKNNFELNAAVKTVTLAKDKMSAEVVMFANLADATTYKITVAGMETFDKVMSAGVPASIELYAGDKVGNDMVATNEATAINCVLIDINGVDVTTDALKNKVNYTLEKYATDGSYYLSNKKLTIKKEGVDVTVKATYRYTANNKVETVEGYGLFCGYEKEAPEVSAYVVTLDDLAKAPKLDFKKSERPTLKLQVVDTANAKFTMDAANANKIDKYGYVSFEALNPEVAVLNGTTLKAFQTGYASFLVYVDLDGAANKYAPEPVYEFTLEVKDDAAYSHADISSTFVTVSGGADFNTNKFTVSAVDQYGQPSLLTAGDVTIEALSDLAKKVAVADVFTAKDVLDGGKKIEITINGANAKAAFDPALKEGESGSLDYKIKVKNKDEFTFTVNVQMPGEEAGNYVSITAKDTINATLLNEDKMKTPLSVEFEVVEMNCEVKVGEVTGLTVLPEKTEDAVENTYYYKLLKDGKAITANVTGNKVSFALTTTADAVSGSAIGAGKLVSYKDTGAGAYTFELYKGADQIASRTTVVIVDDKGAYNESGDQKAKSVKKAYTKDDILACFTISDRKGNEVLKNGVKNDAAKYESFDVDVDTANDYVFVKKITFYEKVTDGLYVDYVVDINEVLSLTNN